MVNFQLEDAMGEARSEGIGHERIVSHGGLWNLSDLSLLPRPGL
jgi:hypothetical protein